MNYRVQSVFVCLAFVFAPACRQTPTAPAAVVSLTAPTPTSPASGAQLTNASQPVTLTVANATLVNSHEQHLRRVLDDVDVRHAARPR